MHTGWSIGRPPTGCVALATALDPMLHLPAHWPTGYAPCFCPLACLQSRFWPHETGKKGRGNATKRSPKPPNAPSERLTATHLSITDRLLHSSTWVFVIRLSSRDQDLSRTRCPTNYGPIHGNQHMTIERGWRVLYPTRAEAR